MKHFMVYLQSFSSYRMLATPFILKRSAQIFVVCFTIFVAIVLLTPWQQTATGEGRVIAFDPGDRVQNISANIEGRVKKWHVREGDRVKEGDLIARMTDNDPEILKRLQGEREAQVRQIRALEVQLQVAVKNRLRQKALLEDGIASEWTFEQAQMAEARAQRELADSEGKLAQLDVKIARQMSQEVLAPRDGTIQSILAGENNTLVKPSDVIAQLVPLAQERTVELFINGVDLPFIKVDQDVRLQFEGWPILQFAGLPELSMGTFLGRIRVIDSADDGQGRFRVIVAKADLPWPAPELLRQGVRARGWIQMNKVPLYYEIWRLINDLPPFTPPLSGADQKK